MLSREEQLKSIIKQMLAPLKNIPLDIIIESICDFTINPYDNFAHEELIDIVDTAGKSINIEGIESRRPNEVGNYCEPYVVNAIRNLGFKAETPMTPSGKRRSAGYPDIEAEICGKPFYIEVKSYNPDNKDTTQRSFYLSPSKDFKITQDAFHLIFAFEMRMIKSRIYITNSCTVLDAKNLLCDVKYEFNSDNKRMYSSENNLIVLKRKFSN